MAQVGRITRTALALSEPPPRVAGPVGGSAVETSSSAKPTATAKPTAPAFAKKPISRFSLQRRSSILSTAVITVVVPGLFATVALPAYAYTPPTTSAVADAAKALEEVKRTHAQSLSVNARADDPVVARDAFSATSAAEVQRAQLAATYAAYTGPSVADYLQNPPYPGFSLAQVVAVALQYQGVPYMYGGGTPSGFDCSGYVMFVYAQFGIALPHSSAGIGAAGTAISIADARPGDVVILPGHTGIYMGNGQFIDSADYGTVIHVRPIYDGNYYIVRLGI